MQQLCIPILERQSRTNVLLYMGVERREGKLTLALSQPYDDVKLGTELEREKDHVCSQEQPGDGLSPGNCVSGNNSQLCVVHNL